MREKNLSTYSMPYWRSSIWHTMPNINSTILTTPVGVAKNPRDMQVQHWQIPHSEQPGLSDRVGVRVMNPPEGEAMYTCLTSGVAFFPNMLAVPKLEEVDFGVRCIWLNDEEPDWGLKLWLFVKRRNCKALKVQINLCFSQTKITHILYHLILGVVSRFSVNVIDETRVKVKSTTRWLTPNAARWFV